MVLGREVTNYYSFIWTAGPAPIFSSDLRIAGWTTGGHLFRPRVTVCPSCGGQLPSSLSGLAGASLLLLKHSQKPESHSSAEKGDALPLQDTDNCGP